MGDDPSLPLDLAQLNHQALVADAIMKPPITPLLAQAQAAGHPILEGRHMLDGQVDPIWDYLGMGVGS
jgi:shikimate dehydrogenase